MVAWKKNLWIDEEKAILTEMWNKGDSSRVIGDRLHKTRNSILGMANRLGLPKHRSLTRKKLLETPRKPVRSPMLPRAKTHRPPSLSQSISITVTSSGIAFLEMKDSLCHAIIGRDADGHRLVRYCGAAVKEGTSFCGPHYHTYYTPPRWR